MVSPELTSDTASSAVTTLLRRLCGKLYVTRSIDVVSSEKGDLDDKARSTVVSGGGAALVAVRVHRRMVRVTLVDSDLREMLWMEV